MAVALITMWVRALKPQVFLYTQLFVIYDNNGRVVVTRSVVLCIITGRGRPRWIISSEICTIQYILLQPNSMIVFLFIQNILKFLSS